MFVNLSIDVPAPATSKKTIRNYAKANTVSINAELLDSFPNFENHFNTRSVEENWCIFKERIHNLISRYVPVCRVISNPSSPWFTLNTKRMLRKKKRLFQSAKRKGNDDASWSRFREFAKTCKREIRTAKRNFFENDLYNILISNPGRFWKIINPSSKKRPIISDPTGKHLTENEV